jgi:hypothetical protein
VPVVPTPPQEGVGDDRHAANPNAHRILYASSNNPVVSEESVELWRDRTRAAPLGGHVELLARPFCGQPETPGRLSYELVAETGEFRVVADVRERQFEENWQVVVELLRERKAAATHKEIHAGWPADADKPSEATLYHWLNQAHAKKLVRREGQGTNRNPWRWRLENEDDAYYDRGELPPMPGLL